MPSKNKNIIRRRKTRKQQHRSRKHKRNNNNARNQTIRGGSQWMWWKKKNRVHPEPHLPTNVDSVENSIYEEVSRGHRDYINRLKKHVEPRMKEGDALVANKGLLEARLAILHQDTSRENREARHQIRNEILGIIREISTKIREIKNDPTLREIRTKEREDASYRETHHLPELPPVVIPDAGTEINRVTHDLDVDETRVNRGALNAEFKLGVESDKIQSSLDQVMSEMSGSPRGSVPQRRQIYEAVKEVARGLSRSSTPSRRDDYAAGVGHLQRGPPSSYF